MSAMKVPDECIQEQPQAKRLRSVELRAVAGGGVLVVGVDVAPATVGPAHGTIDVVELPALASAGGGLVDQIAEAVVAKLAATGVVVAPAVFTSGPERAFIDAAEAAAILGISRDAFDKRVQRRQVPGVVRTAGRRIQIDKAKMLAGLAKRGR